MVRSDRYRWYELDRAKLYGESDEEQYKNGQRPERQQRIFARDCAANSGSGGFVVIARAAKTKISAKQPGRGTIGRGHRPAESAPPDIGCERDRIRRESRREFLFSRCRRRGNRCCGSD